jgi:hypothetical protein
VKNPLPPSQPRQAAFVAPMECLAVAKLRDGQQWLYEILCGVYSYVALGCGFGEGDTRTVAQHDIILIKGFGSQEVPVWPDRQTLLNWVLVDCP